MPHLHRNTPELPFVNMELMNYLVPNNDLPDFIFAPPPSRNEPLQLSKGQFPDSQIMEARCDAMYLNIFYSQNYLAFPENMFSLKLDLIEEDCEGQTTQSIELNVDAGTVSALHLGSYLKTGLLVSPRRLRGAENNTGDLSIELQMNRRFQVKEVLNTIMAKGLDKYYLGFSRTTFVSGQRDYILEILHELSESGLVQGTVKRWVREPFRDVQLSLGDDQFRSLGPRDFDATFYYILRFRWQSRLVRYLSDAEVRMGKMVDEDELDDFKIDA